MRELSVVIVSYNTKELLKKCINSLVKYTKHLDYEIIVVDNNSSDGSKEVLKELSSGKKLRLIQNKSNLGFGKANNIGINKSKGKYILLLNSDTEFKEDVLKDLVNWLQKHPDVGVVSCKLLNSDGTVQATGGYFPTVLRVFYWMFFIDDLPLIRDMIKPFHPMGGNLAFLKNSKFYSKPKELDWISGAFMLLRKKVFEDSGLFDTDYFMYTEETDLCYRIKKSGWRIWYLPKWSIVHFGGGSSSSGYPIVNEFVGVKTFFKKHKPPWQFPFVRLFLMSGALIRMSVIWMVKGKEAFKTYAKAFRIS